ncbi:hypothetical protein ACOMHN_010567 [Nucella lapillus]
MEHVKLLCKYTGASNAISGQYQIRELMRRKRSDTARAVNYRDRQAMDSDDLIAPITTMVITLPKQPNTSNTGGTTCHSM